MPQPVLFRVGFAGLVFGVAGALATLPFVLASDSPDASARMLAPAAGLAGTAVGALAWSLVAESGNSRSRAVVAGIVAGLAAHPVMWALVSLGVGSSIGLPVDRMATGTLMSSMFFSVFSMLIYGPFTALLGGAVGWALGRLFANCSTAG